VRTLLNGEWSDRENAPRKKSFRENATRGMSFWWVPTPAGKGKFLKPGENPERALVVEKKF